jgi:hypothetical protein
MFGGHRPIFGCIDHRLSPTQAPFARTAPERTAWDAQRGPIKEVWEWKARTLCVGVLRRAVCTFTATKSRDRVPRRTYRARCNAGGRSHLANPPASAIAGDHSRLGRGRGNGTARRSTAVLCTRVVSSVEAGLRKVAICSLYGGFRTGAALGIEPVISSLAGACPPPLVFFRSAKAPNTRIVKTTTPSSVGRFGVSRGTAKRCRIIEHPSPRRRAFRLSQREWQLYATDAYQFIRDRRLRPQI